MNASHGAFISLCYNNYFLLWIFLTPPPPAAVGLVVFFFNIYLFRFQWLKRHWSILSCQLFYKAHMVIFFFFICYLFLRGNMNIPACCFHTTCLPRWLVNKHDPFIFQMVSLTARYGRNKSYLSRIKPAWSSLSLNINVLMNCDSALIKFSWRCRNEEGPSSPIKTSLLDKEPYLHNHLYSITLHWLSSLIWKLKCCTFYKQGHT